REGIGALARCFASHSSRKDPPPVRATVGWDVPSAGVPLNGLLPIGVPGVAGVANGLPSGLGASGLVARRSAITLSTTAFGLPYLAAESCLRASASLGLLLPSG